MSVRSTIAKDIRSGTVLVVVMVSLLVTSLLGLALVETLVLNHRAMHLAGGQQQCFWLAEAGIQRAVRALANSSDYRGEQWTVSADVLDGKQSAEVTISVTGAAESPDVRLIRVESRLIDDRMRRNACRRELAVSMSPEGSDVSGDAENKGNGSDTAPGEPDSNQL